MKRIVLVLFLLCSGVIAGDKIPTYIDPPMGMYFKDWLLCGPFPNPLPKGIHQYRHDETSLGFYHDYLGAAGGETNIRPYEGMKVVHPEGHEVVWQWYHGYFPLIPLDDFFSPNTQTIAYAACVIRSKNFRSVVMSVTSNDGVRVWQDGRLILDHNTGGTEEPDRDLVPVVLHKGDNHFLIKISQGFGKWSFQFRLLNWLEEVQELENRAYLLSRPHVIETATEWQFFIGQKYKIELLPSIIPATLEILDVSGEKVVAAFDTQLGQKLTVRKTDLNLQPGLHAVVCKTHLPDGTEHMLRTSIFVGTAPPIEQSYQLFLNTPGIDSTSFYGEQVNNIYRCMDFHLKQDVREGNCQAMDLWGQRQVVLRYVNYIDELQRAPSLYHHIFPELQRIELKKSGIFQFAADTSLSDLTAGECQADLDRLKETLMKKNICLQPKEGKAAITVGLVQDMTDELQSLSLPNEEAYAILIEPEGIKVIGASARGLHNALITLRQIFQLGTALPAATILDYPINAHRSAFSYWPIPMDEAAKKRLLEFIDLKYNEIVVGTGKYRLLDDAVVRQGVQEYYDFLRTFHVEPIPTVWLNGEKSWYEGVWLQDEPVKFENDTARFGFQCLVDLDSSVPVIHAEIGGGIVYERDRDYQIISVEPPLICRMPGSNIPDSAVVYLDADIVDRRTHRFFKPCPSEEAVYQEFNEHIRKTIEAVHPQKIHVSHDELGILNSDSRCLKRHKKDYELVAYQINRMRDIIKNHNPSVDMIMWADAVNPYHNGGKKKLEKVADLLYKDIIMAHWYYSAENYEQVDLLELGTKFFLDNGFRMYGCPWDHMVNHQVWERLTLQNNDDPKFYGLMHTQWGGRNNGLSQTAAINWSGKTWLTK